jgi:PAT family beta-lactamase induction signal transducer AmpG
MSSHYLRIFQQPKSAILLILGFASGLPLALTSGTLQAWMTVENIDLKTIGFFSLVGQAYVFKFLWSPVMDRYTPPFPRASPRLAGDDPGPAAAGHRGDGFLEPPPSCAGWRRWRW